MSDVLIDRLDAVRSRLRRVHLLAGFCQTLLAALGLLALFFLLDWLVLSRSFEGAGGDLAARAVLLAAMVAVLGWVVWRTIVTELRTERDDDEIALRVERSHPKLRGRLISTVQLARTADDDDTTMVSSEMIDALAEETVSFSEALDFGTIINRRTLSRVGVAALVLVLLAGGLGWWRRDYAAALAARLSLTRAAYPTATRIISVTPGGAVGRGDDFAIEVELDPQAEVPDAASATLRQPGGATSELALVRALDAPDGRALFRGTVTKAVEDFSFRPHANDARWATWEQVAVRARPALKALSLAIDYPGYLGRAAETSAIGDIRVPVGTRVTISAALTKPVAQATLTLRTLSRGEDGKPVEAEERRPMDLDAARAQVTSTITVESNGSWSIALQDDAGFANASPISYSIAAIPDRVPSVSIQFPAADKAATKYARWPIRFTARDDHRVAKARLRYLVSDPDAAGTGEQAGQALAEASMRAAEDAKAIDIEIGPGGAQVVSQALFDLATSGAREGHRVTYWIEAQDNREPAANVGASARYSFNVLDLAAMREQYEQERRDMLKQIKELRDKQQDIRDGVEGVRSVVP